jgi:murein DD-endopeptidase MepM/ murein hydrolase activator NlpD
MQLKNYFRSGKPLGWLIVAALLSGIMVFAAEGPEVSLSAARIRPGDFFTVKVKAAPNSRVTLKFLGSSKQLYAVGNTGCYFGLAAASYRTVPGKYPLAVEIDNGKASEKSEQTVTVVCRSFVEQRITVSKQMQQNTATAEKQAKDAQTGLAVRQKAEQLGLPPMWSGAFIMPVSGRKTSDFGLIRYVNNRENGRHSGWDLAAPTGTPVVAVNEGRVVFAGTLYATGYTVILHHGLDLYSAYAHLSKITVQEGERVGRGQQVGKVGATGLATGPHLHLTMRVGEIPVDPALFIDKTVDWD